MKFRPLHDRVVIERTDAEAAGGIIIPDTAQEKPQQGKVIAVGPGGRDETGNADTISVVIARFWIWMIHQIPLRLGAVIDGKPSPWITVQEKAVRAMVALSMRLRLSPQSRIDPKTLGRQQGYVGPKPWELRPDEAD
jgi:chaperonin subunit